MSRRAKRLLRVTLLILFVFRPGLGSLVTWFDVDQEGTRYGLIYSGIRFDLKAAFDHNYMQHFPPGKLIALIDLPASLFSDTVALPVTAIVEYRRSHRTDQRLDGKWKSDRDRTMEEFHRETDQYNPSEEIVRKFASGLGTRCLTFSGTTLLIESGGVRESFTYRIVLAGTNRLVLSLEPVTAPAQSLSFQIEFDQGGFWYWPESGGNREYFRKLPTPN